MAAQAVHRDWLADPGFVPDRPDSRSQGDHQHDLRQPELPDALRRDAHGPAAHQIDQGLANSIRAIQLSPDRAWMPSPVLGQLDELPVDNQLSYFGIGGSG
jgi:hypothetical protein